MNRLTKLLLTLLTLLVLSACGGGGGGDAPPQELVYSGNTNSAVITLENATTLVGNVLFGGDAGTNIPAAVMLTEEINLRSAGAVVQSNLLHNISQNIQDSILKNNTSLPGLAVGVVLDEPLECDSGSGNLAGTLNDSTFTGTLTVTYSNCLLDDVTYNGTGTFRIDNFDLLFLEIADATITFTLLTISSPEFTGSMSGAIRIQSMISTTSNTEKMTLNYVSKDNLTGKMYKFENMIITIVYDEYFYPSSMTETVTGTPARAYDSIHGYVDVDTLIPLAYSSITLDNPDIGGIMLFTGAAGSIIRVTVLSGDLIQLELDIDGEPGYEVFRILHWDELSVNAETDLSDTDNDGMPDSWETTYGLNPHDPSDALQDADGDGVSNYQEYLNGTDPLIHEIEALEVPITSYLTGFSSNDYRGQTFMLQENATAESLTVHIGNILSTSKDFRVLVVEVVTSPEFHPTNVLYESDTISIPQNFTDTFPVTVNLGSINLNAGQTYAWILDSYVAYDGTSNTASTAADSTNSYPDGFMFYYTPHLLTDTREDHFADSWVIFDTYDKSFTLEYRPIINSGL